MLDLGGGGRRDMTRASCGMVRAMFVPSHAPQGTLLIWIVKRWYQDWLAYRNRIRRSVAELVRREFERFLRCGDPAFGYAVLGCGVCGATLGIASSCKGRAWCPHCLSRRQAASTRQLVDRVLGSLPVRHWILCLPPHLRYTLGYDPAMLAVAVNAFADAIFRYLRREAKRTLKLRSMGSAKPGAVSFIHRCSANLDTNVHFHCLVPDGVFIQLATDGPVQFCPLARPSDRAIRQVAQDSCRRICVALEARGQWEWISDRSSTVAEGRITFGDRTAQVAKFFPQAARHAQGGVAPVDGAYAFHVNADHLVEAGDRRGLVELVEYVMAPPVTDEQLSLDQQDNILIRMKRARHDRSNVEVMTPFVLLDRLAALVPRPRSKSIRYHGVYAPNANLRDQVVPWPRTPHDGDESTGSDEREPERQARVLLHAKHDPPHHMRCRECVVGRLTLAEVVTPRFRYRKPGWIPPDERTAPRIQDRIRPDRQFN